MGVCMCVCVGFEINHKRFPIDVFSNNFAAAAAAADDMINWETRIRNSSFCRKKNLQHIRKPVLCIACGSVDR